ncbi:hypothetical protein SRABI26_02728 [Arthrobacter sp. Bi26]|uniref:hypothetical protein n=1 Tax=Arthrobacter sp. Bi26 TaxID=2822350 RepID=UPI001DBFA276|nr:hypothetical protein [Arthrobacter sp. Bi26]CAH0234147.1 hypothetical protein SRABI26_02728 [Arthrobacter sp. Bi26]
MAKITFANDHTTSGGRTYKGGSTHEVNDADARSLILRGKARLAVEKAPAPAGDVNSASAEPETPAGEKKGS